MALWTAPRTPRVRPAYARMNARSPSSRETQTIKALCIAQDLDRPTRELFLGLARAGIDVTVASPGGGLKPAEAAHAGVRVLDTELNGWLRRGGVFALRAELARGRYDVVHALGNRALENCLIASRGLPARIVAYRGIVGNVSALNPVSWMRFLHPRIDRIICVCDAVKRFFLTLRPALCRPPAHKLVRIYKGHDPTWYRQSPADLEVLGIPRNAFVVCCTANYRPRKGIEYLVDAVASLPRDLHVHLLLVGDMQAKPLLRRIRRSAAADRIHLPGYRDDAPAFAAASDVFALPSIEREGLSRALIEAMIRGVPAVVTDCGGNPEIVTHGESGLVVPVRDAKMLADAIRRTYDNPELRRAMGRAARERIRTRFGIHDTIEQTLDVYRAVTAGAE